MTKKIYETLVSGSNICPTDLNAVEKRELINHFLKNGLHIGKIYRRVFKTGFAKWEILGISHLQDQFLLSCIPNYNGCPEAESRGYGYVLSLRKQDGSTTDNFYDIVQQIGADLKLCYFMSDYGMKEKRTVRKRFRTKSWEPWEMKGVRTILREVLEQKIVNTKS